MANTEAQIINGLVKRGWLTQISDEKRMEVVMRLVDIITNPKSKPREVTSATTALAAFDRLDIERAKMALTVSDTEDGAAQKSYEYTVVDGMKEVSSGESDITDSDATETA